MVVVELLLLGHKVVLLLGSGSAGRSEQLGTILIYDFQTKK